MYERSNATCSFLRIGGRYEKGKTRPTLVFDKAELEAFKAELEQKLYKPVVEPPSPDNAASNDKARREVVGKLPHTA